MLAMSFERRMEELDRLLNDPDVPFRPADIWDLLASVQQTFASEGMTGQTGAYELSPAA